MVFLIVFSSVPGQWCLAAPAVVELRASSFYLFNLRWETAKADILLVSYEKALIV
jgi:hypothetical protein